MNRKLWIFLLLPVSIFAQEPAVQLLGNQPVEAVRPPTNYDGTPNQFFDTHAELTKTEVDEALAKGLVPQPKHESPVALPQRQEPKQTRVQRAVETRYPLNPTEIDQVRREVDLREKALNDNPEARTGGKVINVSLQDVRTIPKINIAQGYVANLAFVDSFGNPWPVQGKSVGSTESFNILELGLGEDSNQIQIQGKRSYGSSNIIVLLKGASAPLVFDLKGAKSNDSRVDIVVAGTAPGAEAPRPDAILPPETDTAYSKIMVDLRNGVIADSLMQLHTDAPLKVYQEESGALYVVGQAEIIQPACQAIVYGNAGMRICKIDYVPSTLLYVQSGQVMRGKIRTTR